MFWIIILTSFIVHAQTPPSCSSGSILSRSYTTEELEERLEDEESERASLVSRYSRQNEPGKGPGFLSRLLFRFNNRSTYEPINGPDE